MPSRSFQTDDGTGDDAEEPEARWDDVPCDDVLGGKGFSKNLKLRLTVEEAHYLRTRLIESDSTSGSLIARRLEKRDGTQRDYVWTRPEQKFAPWLRQARLFSAAARGASYVYECLVEEKKAKSKAARKRIASSEAGFSDWWGSGRRQLAEWNLEDFATIANSTKTRGHSEDLEFFGQLKKACAGPRVRFIEHLAPHIVDREHRKRPRKSRLHESADPRLLSQWHPTKHRNSCFSFRTVIVLAKTSFATSYVCRTCGAWMFDISRRRSLCQLLAPPAHFIFEAGVATTYTLDFMALTTSLRALSGRGSSNAEDSAAEEILKVLFGMRNRIVVFVNQASINPPSVTAPSCYTSFTTSACAP